MAVAGAAPRMDPQAGAAALDEDIPRVLRMHDANRLEDLDWRRPDKLTLLVPMRGMRGETRDDFLLKLAFHSYREWPPSAQFVNPDTLRFQLDQDDRWVPKLTSEECRTHLAYGHPRGGTIQLICCSATWEFYDVNHSVEARYVWDGKSTFYSTIVAIRRAMTDNYEGRFGEDG